MTRQELVELQLRRSCLYIADDGIRIVDTYAGVDLFDEDDAFDTVAEAALGACFIAEYYADYE